MKRCTGCKLEKPLEAFNRRQASRDGRQPLCRQCGEAARRASRAMRREREQATAPVYVSALPALALLERMGREEGGKRAVARLMAERFGGTWDAWERSMYRWEATGKMSERDADRFACVTGHHMDELWASERGAA